MTAYETAADAFTSNQGQLDAYNSTGNCVILAGPGSGKTRTLTTKMARILSEDVKAPRGVACITYSTECAAELQRRLLTMNIVPSRRIFIGTVHSFCFQRIAIPFGHLVGTDYASLNVVGEQAQTEVFQQAVKEVMGADANPTYLTVRFDKYRRIHLDHKSPVFNEAEPEMAALILRYESILQARNLLDFDEMVFAGLRLVQGHKWVRDCIKARYPVLIVDEYQDLGSALHSIVMALCLEAGIRLVAVGDPDQSIYGFTGAQPELLAQLSQHPEVESVTLRLNYRCAQTIIGMAETALGTERGYTSANENQGIVQFHEYPEGLQRQAEAICNELIPEIVERRGIALGNIAILYIDKNDANVVADAATAAGYSFVRTDRGTPYRRSRLIRWLESCAAWGCGLDRTQMFSQLTATWLGFFSHLTSPAQIREVRAELIKFLFQERDPETDLLGWISELEKTSFRDALAENVALGDEVEQFKNLKAAIAEGGPLSGLTMGRFCGHTANSDHLNLVTLHSAKGLEFEVVIMFGLEEGRLPRSANSEEALREPRRLFYVGLTRAKTEVHLCYSGWFKSGRRRFENGPSRFIGELQARL